MKKKNDLDFLNKNSNIVLSDAAIHEIEEKTGKKLSFSDLSQFMETRIRNELKQYYNKNIHEPFENRKLDLATFALFTCIDFLMKCITGHDMNLRRDPQLCNEEKTFNVLNPSQARSIEEQMMAVTRLCAKYQAAGFNMKPEDFVKDQYKAKFSSYNNALDNEILKNINKQEAKFSQNRFLKNDNDPFTKIRMRQMVNAPKQQEPIKINTNINNESIFNINAQHDNRLFKTTNHTDEQISNNYDQNNMMGV